MGLGDREPLLRSALRSFPRDPRAVCRVPPAWLEAMKAAVPDVTSGRVFVCDNRPNANSSVSHSRIGVSDANVQGKRSEENLLGPVGERSDAGNRTAQEPYKYRAYAQARVHPAGRRHGDSHKVGMWRSCCG